MRQTQLLSRTKKEAPKGAEAVSHKYLTRGDFVDQIAAGIYTFLPLGWRVYKKVENIIREEMNKLGGQELFMPALVPKKLWSETGRWEKIDPPLFVVKDRHEKEYGLGSTHEEVITDLVRRRVQSYQELPFSLYQIQNKFRNEMRATGGLLRVREFIMKDLYSFHTEEDDLMDFYHKVKDAYIRIFERCGLQVVAVEAESGTIGGSLSHEFMLLAETGEDRVLICEQCGYGANVEKIGEAKTCPECQGNLIAHSCVEAGHAFKLGTKYSEAMGANFIDKDGKSKPILMGCYGIGLGRLIASVVEASHDDNGIIWSPSIAPYSIHLIELSGKDTEVRSKAEDIYRQLENSKKEVLFDDRGNKAPGEKFADADLIGIPLRIVVSQKTLAEDSVEIKYRNQKESSLCKIKELDKFLADN